MMCDIWMSVVQSVSVSTPARDVMAFLRGLNVRISTVYFLGQGKRSLPLNTVIRMLLNSWQNEAHRVSFILK